jgi:signal transduction histidine kinase/CheY-like chemotaxis protein/PAS domain-containing protein
LKRSIARFLWRHRDRIVAAAARPLAQPLGHARAEEEAGAFVDELTEAFQRTEPLHVLLRVQARFAAWQAAGVPTEALVQVMIALWRSPSNAGPPAEAPLPRDLRALVDLIPAPIVVVDAEGAVTMANRAFAELDNDLPEVLVGTPLRELLEGEPGAPPGTLLGTLPEGVRLRSQPDRLLRVSQVPFSAGGSSTGWLVTLTPETHGTLSEDSLAELLEREKLQKQKFAALLTVSHAVINTLDLNTLFTTIAQQVRQVILTDECTVFLFDEVRQELYPVVCDATAWVEELMAVRLKLGQGITGTVALTGRGEIVNDSESDPRAMAVPGTPPEQSALLCVPLLTRDRVVGVITLTRQGGRGFHEEDLELATLFAGQCSAAITNARLYDEMKQAFDELRETQAQLVQSAKLNALGEMAGGVAHDFNNILAAILGRTQLLLQTVSDPEIRRQLAIVEQAALDGAHTVRRVQEFTRVRQDEHFETIDLNQVLLGVLELTRPAWESGAKRRGVSIDVHLELLATSPTAGNASELREVFTNLVLNAVDALPHGGALWVSTENGPETVRVRVRDNGVGMDADIRAKIFDPFFTTKEIKGTGLGLSVAYGIVSRHRGTIDVDSTPGEGTEFTLSFPVGEVTPTGAAHDPLAPLPRQRVLVVDDEAPVLEVLGDMLVAMGMDVVRAHGGAAGVDAVRAQDFDVVFTDLGMPEVNGWDLALEVKSRRPDTAVVLATGWGFQLEEDAATSRGVDLVMAKPFSWEDVENAVRQLARPGGSARAA